ncbi:MAG TPA: hypothetical protein VFD76_03300 [Gemmatimonadales bacterium]|jgi:hypothetical protein|nr:hypothetical protein [Gemmatimonadales bacterium]
MPEHWMRWLSAALLVPAALAGQAPARRHVDVPPAAPRAADVATVDGVVQAYYDVITGPAGQPRQWSRDRSLYIPDLRFVATGVAQGRPYARVMTHQDFVDASDSGMVHDGFFEREIHRVTRSYGNIVQVFSTYEEHRTADGPVEGRGINALQLYWDGARWWVASAIWFEEDPTHPIPREFLP